MEYSAGWWLFLNILSIMVLAFYSMLEMACVTFNKVRLQYYVNKGIRQAIWLNYLLNNSSRLFGTTLLGVNIALFAGSECSREFYRAIGLDPDFAPITQVILVVIFGELAPMFAARRYAEDVAMLGIPLIYFSSKIMAPFLWIVDWISRLCNLIIGGKGSETNIFLTQEELLKIIEEQDEDIARVGGDTDFNTIAANIFSMRSKSAYQIMEPLTSAQSVPLSCTVDQIREILMKTSANYVLVYQRDAKNIVGIVQPRDLIRIPGNRKVRDYLLTPWFVLRDMNVLQILKQFRSNNQSLAIILDKEGLAIGLIHLDDIMEEIFGKTEFGSSRRLGLPKDRLLVERTFPADMRVGEFNKQYDVVLDEDQDLTLAELMEKYLGHQPTEGESIQIGPFELIVKEASLLETKRITVSTRM